ncbi:ATP-binding cassette subfamily G member 4 isoform X1 [Halyomorpha halys]|uniref:ATP-binding cassette subfamily G member 4 isoform X1 n=2 Tax=Halyomorpha halys TaxID=286706 RepID=UPI0006D51CBB|nr:ATP-binding cassette sub-family G member 4-like [Halyomorpha halys]
MSAADNLQYWRDMAENRIQNAAKMTMIRRQPVDIEFTDLCYSVPVSRTCNKLILRNVSGYFKSGELTAILGPSGAGKSTLLNVLAGYRIGDSVNSVLVNGETRDIKTFRKLSRYIMQEDVHQHCLTVLESLQTAAELKLGKSVSKEVKMKQIMEILDLLRLMNSKDTYTSSLSGGEKKRLSIALELVNNPPVLFLDEPTTGLDDLSSAQCITLLKSLARGGRTVICSIHTPSAKLFSLFDNVYIVAQGQCVYQGHGDDIVPFLESLDIHCPKHYNPADFIIDVSSGEYGNHHEKMVRAIDNGKKHRWSKKEEPPKLIRLDSGIEDIKEMPDYGCSFLDQFTILLSRMSLQIWRDWSNFLIKVIIHLGVGLLIGALFFKYGNDASKTIFNFGFCFMSLILFMYVPMLPAIVWFPQEVKCVKREFFNRWYGLNAYYFALSISRIPFQMIQGIIYIGIVYIMTEQPLEVERIVKFTFILALVILCSEAFGMVISARLSIVNGIFVGPAISVPNLLLSVYGLGSSITTIPLWIRISMYFSYLRFGLEGLVITIYGGARENLVCPEEEVYCPLKIPKQLLKEVGMEHANFWRSCFFMILYFIIFKVVCYFILRQRLKRSRSSGLVWLIGRFIKTHFNLNH